jgi:hypothetical protein
LRTGKFMQYVPEDWVYTYFRYDDKSTVMIIMNTDSKEKKVRADRYAERTSGFTTARNIVDGTFSPLSGEWKVPGKTIWILELK